MPRQVPPPIDSPQRGLLARLEAADQPAGGAARGGGLRGAVGNAAAWIRIGPAIAAALGPICRPPFLNNGYRFFAPEPGPGHLVRYEIVTRDGRQIEGSFPDRTGPMASAALSSLFHAQRVSQFAERSGGGRSWRHAYAEVVCRASGAPLRRPEREALFAAAPAADAWPTCAAARS